jgi:peptidoglycan/LPS O-acetylase OafA/YrhL
VTLLVVAALQFQYTRATGTAFVYENNDLRHFLLQLLLASNWSLLDNGYSCNGPVWSVSVEVAAYGAFFILCRFRLHAWRH